MYRAFSLLALAGLCLLFPTRLMAGGPPWLSLPIDGVTSENAKACSELLTAKLGDKLSPQSGQRFELRQHAKQWYLTCYLGQDMALGDIEGALQGSEFSIPRKKLQIFGHVVLEIDTGKASPKKLSADLKSLEHVSVAASEAKEGHLSVTVDMPYPVDDGQPRGKVVGWDKFQRNDLSSDPATKSEAVTTAGMLPSYGQFRDLVAKHKGMLSDIRWSTNYACRSVGCVVATEAKVAAAK